MYSLSLTLRLSALIALLFCGLGTAPALGDEYVEGEILVRFTAETSQARIAEIENEQSLTLIRAFSLLPVRHYALPEDWTVPAAVHQLNELPEVRYAEPNGLSRPQAVPTDPDFNKQWSLHNSGQVVNGLTGTVDADIDLPEALDLYSGNTDVIVAVIDSGVALLHPEFVGKIWINSPELFHDGIDNDGNGYIDDDVGWDFVDNDPFPLDENGHGTLGASLIAASQNNGEGIAGVAPHAKIMALRVFPDTGSASAADILDAISYAAINGAQVINLSLGSVGGFSQTAADTYDELDLLGILCVIAAGNGGAGGDGISDDNDSIPTYPASYTSDNILSVAATDANDELTSFSNYGFTSVDLAAPGKNIRGADVTRQVYTEENFDSGTGAWTSNCSGICDLSNTWQHVYPFFFGVDNWATDSSYNGINYGYYPSTVVDFISPAVPIPLAGASLSFRLWHDLAAGDYLLIDGSLNGGVTWFPFPALPYVFGSSALPHPVNDPETGSLINVDLSMFEGRSSARLRFRLVSDGFAEGDGVFVDDVKITEIVTFDSEDPQYKHNDGTSFSAPIVSGVAALIWSQRPDLTHHQVRDAILGSVDSVPSLAGIVATGGRVNAKSALAAAIALPVPEPTSALLPAAALLVLLGRRRRRV